MCPQDGRSKTRLRSSTLHAKEDSDTMSPESPVVVATARYVLLPLANLLTGYSVKAMERKIERGDWPEGKLWKRAPDGRVVIDIVGYHKWVEGP
jgi:hypothetical protein